MVVTAQSAEPTLNLSPADTGKLPAAWNTASIGGICVSGGLVRGPFGGAIKKEFFVESGQYKVYEQRNAIYRDAEVGTYRIDGHKFKELKRFAVKPGDFIISCSGTIGRIYQIPAHADPGIINQALLKVTTDSRIIYDRFFYHVFDWDVFQDKVIDNTQGGAMPNLVGMDIFREITVPLPPLAEQHAIADALDDIDNFIESQNRLIAKKRALKQGLIQQLLSGTVRLPGFTDEWKDTKLRDVATVLKGSGLSKTKIGVSGRTPCVLYGELFTTYQRVISDVVSRTDWSEGTPSRAGDVLVPGSTTTVGADLATASALLRSEVLLGGDINIIRSSGGAYDPIFLAYCLTETKKQAITERAQGITIVHLYGRDLLDIEIAFPSLEEQRAIVNVLTDVDADIAAEEQRRDKSKVVKQGMEQELLTGRKRLV